MRDIFDDIYKHNPLDPEELVRRNMRVDLRKRFYEKTSVDESDGAFRVLLDGKPVKTPARRNLAAPSRALAQNIADEWDAQKDVIDPGKMPLTRLANSIIDGVVDAPGPVAEEIEKYLGSDLLFYRADGPEGLTKAQETHWDPVVAWARDDAPRPLHPGGRGGVRPAAGGGDQGRPRGHPGQSLGAGRGAFGHDPDRVGLAGAGAGRRAAGHGCGLGGGACGRGLEPRPVGPGRRRHGPPRAPICGHAGGRAGA